LLKTLGLKSLTRNSSGESPALLVEERQKHEGQYDGDEQGETDKPRYRPPQFRPYWCLQARRSAAERDAFRRFQGHLHEAVREFYDILTVELLRSGSATPIMSKITGSAQLWAGRNLRIGGRVDMLDFEVYADDLDEA
jgi:hypothetical protein